MIALEMFQSAETRMIYLAKLWNIAEADPLLYGQLFEATPHEIAHLIGNNTDYKDWQEFVSDSRIQEYVDREIYTRTGRLINTLMKEPHLSQADSARLSTAIKYRDDHKSDFAQPTQYIYMCTPLTYDEQQFLPKQSRGDDI